MTGPEPSAASRPASAGGHPDSQPASASKTGAESPPEVSRGVAEEQVRLLFAQAKGGLLVTLMVSGLLGAVLWETPVRPRVVPWFAAVLGVLLGRTVAAAAFGRGLWAAPGLQLWRRIFVAGASAQGALWGLCGVLLFPAGHPEQQFFLMVVLSGMAGGAVAYLFPAREAFVPYAVLTLLPPSLRILWEGTPMHAAVGLCGLVFLAGMLFAAHRSHQWLTQALRLGFEKQSLADHLTSALAEAAQTGRELGAYRERLESLVVHRTAELQEATRRLEGEVVERRQAQEALARSEKQYRHLVENIDDVIYASDLKGRITFISPAIAPLAGYDPAEVVGRRMDEFVHPEDRDATTTAFLGTLRGEKSVIECRILTRGGEARWVRSSGTPIPGKEGPTGVQGVITDLQEAKRAEEHRRALEARLLHAQRMEAMGTLAGGIAHEFRNILQVIRGHGELALLSARSEGTARDQLRKLLAAVDRGADLSGKLLTFSRRADGKEQAADLGEMVAGLGAVLQRILPRSVTISLAPAPRRLPVSGDPAQLEQVLVNLALNARDAMPEGGSLRIATEAVTVDGAPGAHPSDLRPGRYARVEVEDTGHGMEPETVRRVFDPFFTTKEVGRGTGLGLSIAYGIVQGYGGTVTCESAPGAGARFRVYLPLLAEPRAEPGPSRPGPLPEPECQRGDETILLVEDERSVRDVAADFLESCGYRVLRAASGEEAVALYQAARGGIDLVLMDLGMGGMGGRRALEALSRDVPGVPAIVATGYATEGGADELASLGVHRVIAKPYGLSALVRAVRSVLDEARALPAPPEPGAP